MYSDQQLTVAAEDVQVGDRILNNQATHPAFRWARVNEVVETTSRVRLEGGASADRPAFELITSGWYTVKVQGEGVCIRRNNLGDYSKK